jgi:serine/threonine protein phosphatase PrpC
MPQTKVYDNNVSDKEKMVELGKKAMFDQVAGQAINQAAPRYLEQGYAKGMQDNNLTSQMAYEQGLAEAQLAMDPRLASLMQQNQDMYGQANTPEVPRSAFLENSRGY